MSEHVKPKLLVVTDDPNQRLALSEFLEYEYHVLSATNEVEGTSALSQFKRKIPVVIAELKMLKRTGLTLLTKAKQEDPALQILIVKCVESEALSEHLAERTAVIYLQEPFTYDQLKRWIDEALKLQSGRGQSLALSDLIQLYCLSQAKIALTVVRTTGQEEERGKIYFEDGNIVNAACGGKRAEDALYDMFRWEPCRFFPRYNVVAKQKAIRRQWEDLLFIGLQRAQEPASEPSRRAEKASGQAAAPQLREIAPAPKAVPAVTPEPSSPPEPPPHKERAERAIPDSFLDPALRETVQHILEELHAESDNLQSAIVIDAAGQVVSALTSDATHIDAEVFNTLLWKTIEFSAQLRQRLDLGDLNEVMVLGTHGGIVVLYPIKNFGVLGVTTLKESQGMVRWNCTEALLKLEKLIDGYKSKQ